jgi:hypothetical protein
MPVPLFSGFALFRDLLNINVKDTPKTRKTLHERRLLREIEEKRETLKKGIPSVAHLLTNPSC